MTLPSSPEAGCPRQQGQRGREIPVLADVVELLEDLKSFHRGDLHRPLFYISRQWVSKSMKGKAVAAGKDPARD